MISGKSICVNVAWLIFERYTEIKYFLIFNFPIFMKGYLVNIEQETLENTSYRRVLYTAPGSQLVLMSLLPGEEIGEEVHELDQFIRIESGSGKAILDGVEHDLLADWAVVIPRGTRHNVVNTGTELMKLYTIYSPPEHKDGIVFDTKAEADAAHEHFDGKPTEAY